MIGKNIIDMRRYANPADISPVNDPDRANQTAMPFSAVESRGKETLISRDALGQMPLHIAVKQGIVHVANSIKDLQLVEGIRYEDTQVVPHASTVTVTTDGELTIKRNIDFQQHVPADFDSVKIGDVEYSARYVRQ